MDNKRMIYRQIICDLENNILAGKLQPRCRIPSVRALAVQYQVNPNTVQRAIRELKYKELLISLKGKGIIVTEDARVISRTKQNRTDNLLYSFIRQMKELGYSCEQIMCMVKLREDVEK